MKINEIIHQAIGSISIVDGPKISRELISLFSQTCGSKSVSHIVGKRSALSAEGKACLHGVGTLCLLNEAVEKVIQIDGEHDIVLYGFASIRFESPNREGNNISFRFKVTKIESSRIPIGNKVIRPVTKVTFDCDAFNPDNFVCQYSDSSL